MKSVFVSNSLTLGWINFDFVSDGWSHQYSTLAMGSTVCERLIYFTVTALQSEDAFAELYYSKRLHVLVDFAHPCLETSRELTNHRRTMYEH